MPSELGALQRVGWRLGSCLKNQGGGKSFIRRKAEKARQAILFLVRDQTPLSPLPLHSLSHPCSGPSPYGACHLPDATGPGRFWGRAFLTQNSKGKGPDMSVCGVSEEQPCSRASKRREVTGLGGHGNQITEGLKQRDFSFHSEKDGESRASSERWRDMICSVFLRKILTALLRLD